MNNGRDCEHGHLARSCEICLYESEIAELREDIELLLTLLEVARPVNFWRSEPKQAWHKARLDAMVKYGRIDLDELNDH